MAFDSFAEFLAMGGYGFYVWISFGLSFLSLIALGLWSVWYKKRLFSIAQREMQRIERIKAARKKRREGEGGARACADAATSETS